MRASAVGLGRDMAGVLLGAAVADGKLPGRDSQGRIQQLVRSGELKNGFLPHVLLNAGFFGA